MLINSDSFIYNGVSCKDFGLILGNVNGNSYQVGINQEVIFAKEYNNDRINYFGRDKKPMQFKLSVFQKDGRPLTVEERSNIMAWLYGNRFCGLAFEDNLDIVYSCMPIGRIEEIDYGGLFGFTIEFVCEFPYATTRAVKMYFDCMDNKNFSVFNKSNLDAFYYDTEIELVANSTDILIRNLSDGNSEFAFNDLEIGEKIYVHNGRREIVSSLFKNRFYNFNREWIRLVYGINYFEVEGDCSIEIKAKFPIVI